MTRATPERKPAGGPTRPSTSRPAADEFEKQQASDLNSALADFATQDRILVALDFDGTLAPLVDDPAAARALPASSAAVLRLIACAHTSVAFVSGRALESLVAAASPPSAVILAGSHGAQLQLPDSQPDLPTPHEVAILSELMRELEVGGVWQEGVRLETKPLGVAIHTRLASAAVTMAVRDAVAAAADRIRQSGGQLYQREGKDVLEFSTRPATKADAISAIRAAVSASAVLYAGDDVTDEDAFAVLTGKDIGIKVGQGSTRAAFRVTGPEAMPAVLNRLAELRSQEAASPRA